MERDNRTLIGALAILAAVLIIGFGVVGPVVFLYSATFVGGLVVWLLTAYRTVIPIDKVLPPYLLTAAFFIAHVCEEYLTHIERVLGRLMHIPLDQGQFLIVAAFVSPIMWLAGPLLVMVGRRLGYFLMCVFLFGMMFGETSHFLFPFLENGSFHYVAGMYTCLLPICGGWLTFAVLVREAGARSQRQAVHLTLSQRRDNFRNRTFQRPQKSQERSNLPPPLASTHSGYIKDVMCGDRKDSERLPIAMALRCCHGESSICET